jgi:SAM-dependent methyltransferase
VIDPIGNISRIKAPIPRRAPRRIPPCSTIYPFLQRALFPGPSSNQSTERFDTALIDSLVHFDSPLHILDLGCGGGLILEKIQQSHPTGNGEHLTAPCHYFGIDLAQEGPKWQKLKARCPDCFPTPRYLTLDLTDDFLRRALEGRKFDFIFLANVLHEIPPKGWPKLLSVIFDHMEIDGKLVIIDPDADWCFEAAAWTPEGEWHLNNIPVEWEIDAVWLSRDAVNAALRAMGFEATVRPFSRSKTTLWEATGSIALDRNGPRPDDAAEALREFLERKLEEERTRIPKLRHDLKEVFRSNYELSGELLVKIFEYFAACASQCRRLEAIEDLRR